MSRMSLAPRVRLLIQPVPEPHQPKRVAPILRLGDEPRDVLPRPDGLEHAEHRLVRAAVRGAPEARHPRGDARERVRAARPGDAHRARARVLLVVGVKHENHLKAPRGDGVHPVLARRQREHHVHEVRREREVVARVHDRLPVRGLVRHRRERRHLADDADAGEIARPRARRNSTSAANADPPEDDAAWPS